jgi:hypothetical protein
MGSIIEVTARNELLRRDGRHTPHELLDRIEEHLISRPALERDGDSMAPPRTESDEPKPTTPSWSMLAPNAKTTESSAWIPAAKASKEGKE